MTIEELNILKYGRDTPEILILAACEVLFENEKYGGINETGKEFKKRKTNERKERIFEKPMHYLIKFFKNVKEQRIYVKSCRSINFCCARRGFG